MRKLITLCVFSFFLLLTNNLSLNRDIWINTSLYDKFFGSLELPAAQAYRNSIKKSSQPGNCDVGSTGSCTITLGTAVVTANSIILPAGATGTYTLTNASLDFTLFTAIFGSTTTVTLNQTDPPAVAGTGYVTVAEYFSNTLTSVGVQRNRTDLASATSSAVTITAVGSKSEIISCGIDTTIGSTGTPAKVMASVVKTDSTTLTITRTTSTADHLYVCWQIADWR